MLLSVKYFPEIIYTQNKHSLSVCSFVGKF